MRTRSEVVQTLSLKIQRLEETNRELSRKLEETKFFLEREQETSDSLRREIDETDKHFKEKYDELRRENETLKHELIHLTGNEHRLQRGGLDDE